MRNIVQIGNGLNSFIEFKAGDRFISCDPMLPYFQKQNRYSPPPDFVEFRISEIAIVPSGYADSIGFAYFEKRMESGFILDGSRRKPSRGWKTKKVKALTLDAWLEANSDLGFTEHIDLLYMPTGTPAYTIFKDFSFKVKPKIVLTAVIQEGTELVNLFKAQGYEIYVRDSLLAIHTPD